MSASLSSGLSATTSCRMVVSFPGSCRMASFSSPRVSFAADAWAGMRGVRVPDTTSNAVRSASSGPEVALNSVALVRVDAGVLPSLHLLTSALPPTHGEMASHDVVREPPDFVEGSGASSPNRR